MKTTPTTTATSCATCVFLITVMLALHAQEHEHDDSQPQRSRRSRRDVPFLGESSFVIFVLSGCFVRKNLHVWWFVIRGHPREREVMTISNHDDHEEHDVTSYFLVNFVVTFVS